MYLRIVSFAVAICEITNRNGLTRKGELKVLFELKNKIKGDAKDTKCNQRNNESFRVAIQNSER